MENITDFFLKLPTKFRIIQALLKQPLSLCKIFLHRLLSDKQICDHN